MKNEYRIKRIEKALDEAARSERRIQLITQQFGESKQQALSRAGIKLDKENINIFLLKFGTGELLKPAPPVQPVLEQIDSKIKAIESELRKEGMTGQQIAELMDVETIKSDLEGF